MSQILLERPKESKDKRTIKVVITANGARYEKQGGKLFDWSHEGKVLDIEVGEEEYHLIGNYLKNVWAMNVDNVEEFEEQYHHVNRILRHGLDSAGIPDTYNVYAFFKESFGEDAY